MTETEHKPVLLAAAMAGLNLQACDSATPSSGSVFVDGTYGRGGHSSAILSRIGANARLLAFDKDPQACADAWQRFAREPRFSIERASFDRLQTVLAERNLVGRVNGILLDLGVSSPQLENAERGFSFSRSGPLDMRMDPQHGESVADWLAHAEARDIARVLKTYGDEPFAWRIATAIKAADPPLRRTDELAQIISECIPRKVSARSNIHPATRSFQALRIHINDELGDLQRLLEQSLHVLAPGGRLVVISFHSLEDRIVKRFIREQARPEPPPLPMAPRPLPLLHGIGGAQRASATEVAENPRARSAVLRVAERSEHEVGA